MTNRFPYIFILILLAFVSCKEEAARKRKIFDADYRIDRITLTSNRKGEPVWKFKGTDVLFKDDLVRGKDVQITFFRKEGKSRLSGDRGSMVMKESMELLSNVVYRDSNHIIETEKLNYDIEKNFITIPDTFVLKIEDENRRIRGVNLTTDANFIKIHIGKVLDMKYKLEKPLGEFLEKE